MLMLLMLMFLLLLLDFHSKTLLPPKYCHSLALSLMLMPLLLLLMLLMLMFLDCYSNTLLPPTSCHPLCAFSLVLLPVFLVLLDCHSKTLLPRKSCRPLYNAHHVPYHSRRDSPPHLMKFYTSLSCQEGSCHAFHKPGERAGEGEGIQPTWCSQYRGLSQTPSNR